MEHLTEVNERRGTPWVLSHNSGRDRLRMLMKAERMLEACIIPYRHGAGGS